MASAAVSNIPECSICRERFKAPKFLPCGHTFCLTCIEQCIAARRGTVPCPLCKTNVNIPEGGAKNFPTNFAVLTSQSPEQTKCPNHNQRGVDYYCNNCNIGLCFKCILGPHKEHNRLDIECNKTRNKVIEELERSQKILKNRIKNLKETRYTLLESFEELKSLCEDSCTKVTEKTEQIVFDLRKRCEQITDDIRNNLEENRKKFKDREMEITSEINLLEDNTESNISTKTTLNLLQTLHRLLEIAKQDEKDYNLRVQYLQWVGKDFSLDIDQVGSVISKQSCFISGSYQFIFDISDIRKLRPFNAHYGDIKKAVYYSKNKFRNNNLVWSCGVGRSKDVHIFIKLTPEDNPKLNYCIIDGTISLYNIDDGNKTITHSFSEERVDRDCGCFQTLFIGYELTNKINGQFVIRFNLTQIRDISFEIESTQ